MAKEILLSSESFIKSVTEISDNVAGKYILSSLREAQEVGLKGILGDGLLSTLKGMVRDMQIDVPANEIYKQLLGRCQYYLAYSTLVEVCMKVSYKIGNFGVAKTTDENMQLASHEEIVKMQYYYQSKADGCCYELQGWLLDNRDSFPELDECSCRRIESNLYSAASCGIWLGGPRGKSLPGGRC